MIRFCALLVAASLAAPTAAAPPDATLQASLQRDLNQYLSAHSKIDHISAVSLSISLHGRPETINVTTGRTQYGDGTPVTPQSLWQIGSITKSFTAAIILQLEAAGKLKIEQTVGDWLPQYPAWKNVTIRRLLNMTSGIPSYDDVPAWLAAFANNPKRNWSAPELIAYVYPNKPNVPGPTSGWHYSNTNYLLAQLIIERATGHSYASEFERRFLKSDIGLRDTYYATNQYPRAVLDRMVSGYVFNHDADVAPIAPLLGTDVHENSVSWGQAAGAVVSTPEDVTRWARALLQGPIFASKQRAELLSVVSVKTGKPISKTSLSDSPGFGLGVIQQTAALTGTTWFYEGDTMGFRVLWVYHPRQQAVIAFGLNSQVGAKQNSTGALADAIYQTLHAADRL